MKPADKAEKPLIVPKCLFGEVTEHCLSKDEAFPIPPKSFDLIYETKEQAKEIGVGVAKAILTFSTPGLVVDNNRVGNAEFGPGTSIDPSSSL